MPNLRHEKEAGFPELMVAGVDEAGRGPLAGPVYAVAVVLPKRGLKRSLARRIDDSKRLAPAAREALLPAIMAECAVGIGIGAVEEIDRINILQATFLAMHRAVGALPAVPDRVLVDGNLVPPALPCAARAVIDGDALCLSVAAASIVAKVLRDRAMAALAEQHPGYGWERNAGYGTAEHRNALARLGATIHHRRSFAPVSEQLALTL